MKLLTLACLCLALSACKPGTPPAPSDFLIVRRQGCGMKRGDEEFTISRTRCDFVRSCSRPERWTCRATEAQLAELNRLVIAQNFETLTVKPNEGDHSAPHLHVTTQGREYHASPGDSGYTPDELTRFYAVDEAVEALMKQFAPPRPPPSPPPSP